MLPHAGAALPKLRRATIAPLAAAAAAGSLALPLVPVSPTWVTLTIAGLAMGMMIFIMQRA